MKKTNKRIISLLMAMLMLTSIAMAVDTKVIIHRKYGETNSAQFPPELASKGYYYTETDLFDNFKDVMPGDTLEQKVVIENSWNDYDYIELYFSQLLHDENGNPLTYREAIENLDGKDQSNISGSRDETIASMHEFLAQLDMYIYDKDNNEIFKSTHDVQGALVENISLGRLDLDSSTTLTVKLEVPIELGNEYANRVGEVDWVFTYSGHNYPDEPDDPKPTTSNPTSSSTDPTSPTEPTEPTIDIDDPEIPLDPVDPDNPSSPDTGDHSNMLPYIVLFIVGLMGLILTSKKRKTN